MWDFCSLRDVRAASSRCAQGLCALAFAVRAAAACSSASRHTPLHAAAMDDDADFISLLLEHGAALNARSKSGATPLFSACEAGRALAVSALLAAGAKMWGLTASGENCLYIAALRGHAEVRLLCMCCMLALRHKASRRSRPAHLGY